MNLILSLVGNILRLSEALPIYLDMATIEQYRKLVDLRGVVTLVAEQDDAPVRGNAAASGDDAYDKEVEDAILARLDRGDVWAWASVKVSARLGGCEGVDYLGCCSYDSEADFRRPGDYFDDMVVRAKDELAKELHDAQENTAELAAEAEGL